MEFLLFAPFSIALVVFCVITLYKEISIAKRRSRKKSAHFLNFLEVLFTIAGPVFGLIVNYSIGDPIPKVWMPLFAFLSAIPIVSYWVSRNYKNQLSAVTRAFLKANMVVGIVVALILTYYFIEIIPLGFVFAFYGFPLISPLMTAFILYAEVRNNLEWAPIQESLILDDPRLTAIKYDWTWNLQAVALSLILFVSVTVTTYLISGMPTLSHLSLAPFDLNSSGF